MCYADDTLILSRNRDEEEAALNASLAAATVSQRIAPLGLTLAAQKTETVVFRPQGVAGDPVRVLVDGAQVDTRPCIKYLGLMVDGKWSFKDHFDYAAAKARKVAAALAHLLPNLGGPREHVRKLYLAVVHSVLMYGAPVWYEALGRGRGALRCRATPNGV
ncbi:uncharacterized protein LOC109861396 [Pseudomyrmex gracilis]|uniref:uncharacterized protein LOC109861396 n=1 Tax=Pseudomyrmex gracilis TaxID=219809 RepID=UPI0009955CE2|nr:uncharacterized protein LOC109861396 [Pseudomyrmex gracilis]